DFTVTPVTVNTTVTGAGSASLSGTVNTGTLAPSATLVVPMSSTFNMSAPGTYTFNATAVMPGDGNAANDAITPVNRTNVAPAATPQLANFTSFNSTNLSTVHPGWSEGAGQSAPAGTTSGWEQNATVQETAFGTRTAKINLFSNTKRD